MSSIYIKHLFVAFRACIVAVFFILPESLELVVALYFLTVLERIPLAFIIRVTVRSEIDTSFFNC